MADLEVQEKDGKIYCPLKKAWHVSTPEERVRQYYIAILANKYGYSLEQMDQELKVNNSKRGQGKARADIIIWKSEQDKKDKKAAYRSLIRAELADELYDKILNIIVVQKKYKDPNYSAKDLARELKTNTRYLSAVVNSRFGKNYSCLLNEYRIKDAKHLLVDKRYADKNVEEISSMVGFANRQSFYAAFYKNVGETPNGFRKRNMEK